MKSKKSNPKAGSNIGAVPSTTASSTVPAELKKVVEKAASILNDLTENEIQQRYSLGVVVRDAMAHSKYGDAALAAFAARLGLDQNTLYAHAAVARAWPEKREFDALADRRGETKKAYRLSWSHFVLVATVDDGRVRRGLITAAFEAALSEKDLRALKASRITSENAAVSKAGLNAPSTSVWALARKFKRTTVALNALLNGPNISSTRAELQEAMEVLEHAEQTLIDVRQRLASALARATPEPASVKEAVAGHLQLVAEAPGEAEASSAPATA